MLVAGLATTDTGFENVIALNDLTGTINFITNFFIAADEDSIDLTVETLDSEGNALFTKNFTNVSFKRNRATILKGSMFSAGSSASFSVESTFLESYTLDF